MRDKEMREEVILLESVSNQENPPDELAYNVSKKPRRTNYSFERSESYPCFQLFT